MEKLWDGGFGRVHNVHTLGIVLVRTDAGLGRAGEVFGGNSVFARVGIRFESYLRHMFSQFSTQGRFCLGARTSLFNYLWPNLRGGCPILPGTHTYAEAAVQRELSLTHP